MWGSKNRQASVGLIGCRDVAGPLLLMTACPIATILFAIFLGSSVDGNTVGATLSSLAKGTFIVGRAACFWKPATALIVFSLLNLILLKCLPPVEKIKGPVTPGGQAPLYVDNGIQALFVNLFLFVFFSDAGYVPLYGIDIWMRYLPELFMLTNVFSFALCFWIYQHNQTHRTKDFSTRGNAITDFYVGNELHPTFLGDIDIKQFTNCRFGMMLWPIFVVSAMGCEFRRNGGVSNAAMVAYGLQLAYLVKFFVWEKGYFFTLDMMHDRAGFYLCWGCINWVPCVYALISTFHGVTWHMADIAQPTAIGLFVFGLCALAANYHSDLQRKQFREAGDAVFYIWGHIATYITATYATEDGKKRQSKLLTSGYWGMSRHFNYLAELAFSYTVGATAGCIGYGAPGLLVGLFYPVFLTILLVDRCYRDEARCLSKYGKFWEEYCSQVRYRLIPGLF